MENLEPFVTIPLRDGSQAVVGNAGVRVGDRAFALADIQDARQVAPDPMTIALRVANERHFVELQPVRTDDGALLLEAIYRLRPELRPAGFETPVALPAGFPPMPPVASAPAEPNPWGAQSGWPAYSRPPAPLPGAYMPPPAPMYGPPVLSGGRLTPYPRSAGQLIGAVFELFMAHWQRWLLLALVALILPEVVRGGVDAVFRVLGGHDLWEGLPLAAGGTSNNSLLSGTDLASPNGLLFTALDLAISAAIGAIIGGWAASVLGTASRDALVGRMPQVGSALRAGTKRFLPAAGASILSGLVTLAILSPVIVLYAIILTQYGAALADPNTIDPTSSVATTLGLLGCLTLVLLVSCGALAIYVGIRLALATYIAATESLGPVAALRRSWDLTRGQWWHTFVPIFVLELLVALISIPATFIQYASFGIATLFAVPLMAVLTAPLLALAAVTVLYDLRLRREGFASLASEANAGDEQAPTTAG